VRFLRDDFKQFHAWVFYEISVDRIASVNAPHQVELFKFLSAFNGGASSPDLYNVTH